MSVQWASSVIKAVEVAALMFGRFDIAGYLYLGWAMSCHLIRLLGGRRDLREVARIVLAACALIAFALGWGWLFVLFHALRLGLPDSSANLIDEISKRPSAREYVERSRELCAAGGG